MDIDLHKTQQYLDWLKEKLYLNCIAPTAQKREIHRGEVYRCKFGFGIGSEESKERPCLILQYDSANITSPNTLVAPISHTASNVPVVIPIKTQANSSGKLILDGNVLLGNITCVSKARLGDFITKLSKDEMLTIDETIAKSLGILHHYKSLQNMYNDQAQHLQKVQSQNTILKTNLATLQQQAGSIQTILDKYHISDISSLAECLAKTVQK